MKKFISVLLIGLILFFSIPIISLAHHDNGILSGKVFHDTNGNSITELTDNDHNTKGNLRYDDMYTLLDQEYQAKSFYVDMGTSSEDTLELILLRDGVEQLSYTIENSLSDQRTNFDQEVIFDEIRIANNGTSSTKYIYEFELYAELLSDDTTPPKEVSNVSIDTETDITQAIFNYDLPSDEDFSHVNIYIDGTLHGTDQSGSYIVDGLEEATTYSYELTTEDISGNESLGLMGSFTTGQPSEEPEPDQSELLTPPIDISINNYNGSIKVNYDHPYHEYLSGYNIYLDGEKINDTPIQSKSHTIYDLENGINYYVEIATVLEDGTEGTLSESHIGSPDENLVPVVDVGYSLSDVADGVSVWFSDLWLIIAFATAIPLAFMIGNRVKNLFIT